MEENVIEKKGIYQGSLFFAFLFGGPFVTGWLVSENLKEFGEIKKAKMIKISGIVLGTILFIAPPFIFAKRNIYIGILSLLISFLMLTPLMLEIKESKLYIVNGGKVRSMWPLICIIFSIINILVLMNAFMPIK